MAKFDRNKHVYVSDEFEELIKDTIRFFNGTPVHQLPPPERFHGTGVYAIYYIGQNPLYAPDVAKNRLRYEKPLYVGKAVPQGWRQSRTAAKSNELSYELVNRLNEHSRSIEQGSDLEAEKFFCRFMILENAASAMISTVEAALIKLYNPIWNSVVDGFGNHDPGSGRYQQAKSDWDVIHAGRAWAKKCKGKANSRASILKKIQAYYKPEVKDA